MIQYFQWAFKFLPLKTVLQQIAYHFGNLDYTCESPWAAVIPVWALWFMLAQSLSRSVVKGQSLLGTAFGVAALFTQQKLAKVLFCALLDGMRKERHWWGCTMKTFGKQVNHFLYCVFFFSWSCTRGSTYKEKKLRDVLWRSHHQLLTAFQSIPAIWIFLPPPFFLQELSGAYMMKGQHSPTQEGQSVHSFLGLGRHAASSLHSDHGLIP